MSVRTLTYTVYVPIRDTEIRCFIFSCNFKGTQNRSMIVPDFLFRMCRRGIFRIAIYAMWFAYKDDIARDSVYRNNNIFVMKVKTGAYQHFGL